VECDDGVLYQSQYIDEAGAYKIETGDLDPAKKYRLRVWAEGEEYVSEFLNPLKTPQIDSISWEKEAKAKPIYITISTHDPLDQSRYYRWSYKEDWEFRAEIFAPTSSSDPWGNTFYCWASDASKSFLLGSTERLSENVIAKKRLIEISPDADKISELYRISVTQYQIRQEAWQYYANLQKNVGSTGGIFAPVPSEMKGNVRCVSNPETEVIGYVEVSIAVTRTQFMPDLSLYAYEPPRTWCYTLTSSDPLSGYGIAVQGPPPLYAPMSCLDCRLRGTKNKPEGWPTDHF
jgi:hypothetical protein